MHDDERDEVEGEGAEGEEGQGDDEGDDEGDDDDDDDDVTSSSQGDLNTPSIIANKGTTGLYRTLYTGAHLEQLIQQMSHMGSTAALYSERERAPDFGGLMQVSQVLQDAFAVRVRAWPLLLPFLFKCWLHAN